jgi:uridylate kinase
MSGRQILASKAAVTSWHNEGGTRMALQYRRVLLKLSGEALAGDNKFGLDYDVVLKICESIKTCVELGAEIAIVVGGGNFWRGRSGGKMDRTRADHMGMLATVMNSLALGDALEALGVNVRVQTAINMQQIAEPYIRNRAVRHLEKGRLVIFGCGTGNPFFSTDTASTLRAAEIDADIIFKATMVDGIYDSDPKKNPGAVLYKHLTYTRILGDDLRVMDSTAAAMAKENGIPILVFNLSDPYNIVRAIEGESIGTLVKEVEANE